MKKHLKTFCTLTILIPLSGINGQGRDDITVERIFQRPSLNGVSVSNIEWSPNGKMIAYLRTGPEDVDNDLWVFDVRTRMKKLLMRAADLLHGEQEFSEEELMVRERTREAGTGITKYFWSPDSKEIFIPASGDIFKVDIITKAVTRITKTPGTEFDPKISPLGAQLAYVRESELFVLNLASWSEVQLTYGATKKIKHGISEFIAQEEMGRTTGYWWSPDGKYIAYLQIDNTPVREFHIPNFLTDYTDVDAQEYAKAGTANTIVKIGVVSSTGGATKWLDLGSNTDIYIPRVHWHPDGKRLAVQVQSRNQDTLDLVLFDIERGTSRNLLRETDDRWVRLHDDLRFLRTRDAFIWASERDGYKHLYLYSTKGGLLRQITRGSWEVDKLGAVDEKKGILYFTSTEKSPIERHVYRVGLDGSGFKRLSTSDGWHEIRVSPDRSAYVDVSSTLVEPPRVSLLSLSNSSSLLIEGNSPKIVDRYALPAPEFLTIPCSDPSLQLNALIIRPPAFDPTRRYPVILYVYGGPTSQVVANRWGAGGGMARALWHRLMAKKGYIVFAVDGRGTPGRGRAFQNVLHKRLGDFEVRDQLSGVDYLRSLPYVDPSRIMIWGKSYGGFMTCMALFKTENIFKLGIAVAPVTDWKNYDTHYTERYLEHPGANAEGYERSSPVTYASGLTEKFLLVHGVVDDNVHFQDSMILVEKLLKANIQFDFMPYPSSTHSFSGDAVGTHLYSLLTRYIKENL